MADHTVSTTRVRTGLDRWLDGDDRPAVLQGRPRVALLAHAASVDRQGHHAVERLADGQTCRLVRLLAPEHGLWGHEQDMEVVADRTERHTGLPVISLYGDRVESLAVRPEHLDGIDAVVCDLQDVGSRYYTYVYTIAHAMEAAAEAGIPVVVLDRPNPIGGETIEGPVLHPGFSSFVGRYPIPVRHGMTVGELVQLFNAECDIGCELHVVSMTGWRRELPFEECGLPWVPPSPNMPALSTARVYPGGCLVEGTNLSEARGTTLPFELIGAPWLDGVELARCMRARQLPGVGFRAASFRPMFHKHAGSGCDGVQVLVTDEATFRPFATYLALLQEARRQDPSEFDWRREVYEFEADRLAIDLLLGRADLRPMLEQDASLDEMERCWADELRAFAEVRQRHLIY